MTAATINDNASGITRAMVGTKVEIVGPGANHLHMAVRLPDARRLTCLPTSWLDIAEPEPERCPTCGRVLEAPRGAEGKPCQVGEVMPADVPEGKAGGASVTSEGDGAREEETG